jgi:hypothetical protein
MDTTKINIGNVDSVNVHSEKEERATYHPAYAYLGISPDFSLDYVAQKTYNEYIIDVDGTQVPCFKKYIPLVDYVKYLIGKYKGDVLALPSASLVPQGLFQEAVQSCHNYAYVDSFFYYMTSQLRDRGFIHGIKVYDSYVCLQKNSRVLKNQEFVVDKTFL